MLRRRGADIRASAPVRAIEPERLHLAATDTAEETIDAGTIVLAAGIVPSTAAARIPVAHDARGRIAVDATMRSRSHPQVWALGDCAEIPAPDGRPYPALAQHATREARQLALNVAAAAAARAALDARADAARVARDQQARGVVAVADRFDAEAALAAATSRAAEAELGARLARAELAHAAGVRHDGAATDARGTPSGVVGRGSGP